MKTFIIAVLGIFLLAGCATTTTTTGTTTTSTVPQWQQTATTIYEIAGGTITLAKTGLDVACATNVLTTADCDNYNAIYTTTKDAYTEMGNCLADAIQTTDVAQQQGKIAALNAAVANLNKELPGIGLVLADVMKKNAAAAKTVK